MNLKLPVLAAAAVAFLAAPATARAACCDHQEHAGHQSKPACCDMDCCKTDKPAEPGAIEVLMSTARQSISDAPARQSAEVWFTRPVFAGTAMLLGHYVIEHDYDRMARGEACTHIYAYDDRTKPVSSFHCTHLDRNPSKTNKVVLVTMPDGKTQKLTEFQFAGDPAGHGYPRR